MASSLERIEEHRDRVAGLEYEDVVSEIREERIDRLIGDGYELDDPKHPDHYETLVDIWDAREGK